MKKNIKYILLLLLLLLPVFSVKAMSTRDFCASNCNAEDKSSECVESCINEIQQNCRASCNNDSKCQTGCENAIRNSNCQDATCYERVRNDFLDDYDSNLTLTCDDVKHVTLVYNALRIIAPFLLIIFGSLDFFKALTAGDEKQQRDARKKFPKRIIAFILLIVLPVLVKFVVETFGLYGTKNTTLFCCVVTGGSNHCGTVTYTVSPAEEIQGGSGSGSNKPSGDEGDSENWDKPSSNETGVTADKLCNASDDYIQPKTTSVSTKIDMCVNQYNGECDNINISNQTCKCTYQYIDDVPSDLCSSSYCGLGKTGNKCLYNMTHVSSLDSASSANKIKEVKTKNGWDVYYSYPKLAQANLTDEACSSTYGGICYGEKSNCTCVYEK